VIECVTAQEATICVDSSRCACISCLTAFGSQGFNEANLSVNSCAFPFQPETNGSLTHSRVVLKRLTSFGSEFEACNSQEEQGRRNAFGEAQARCV
jgi:hypothetical protein